MSMSRERESSSTYQYDDIELGKKIKRENDAATLAAAHQIGRQPQHDQQQLQVQGCPPPGPGNGGSTTPPTTTLNTITPCAACKLLRRRCAEECPFSPYFSPHDPQKFAAVHKVFGASNVSKMLMEVPEIQRADAANSLVYEANVRLRDPVYGCMGAISALQHQVQLLQAELNLIRTQILKYKYTTNNIINHHVIPPPPNSSGRINNNLVSVAALPPIISAANNIINILPPPPPPSTSSSSSSSSTLTISNSFPTNSSSYNNNNNITNSTTGLPYFG